MSLVPVGDAAAVLIEGETLSSRENESERKRKRRKRERPVQERLV